MFGCFSIHKKANSETTLPSELQMQFTIREYLFNY